HESSRPSSGVTYRGTAHVRPETRAILPQSPAFPIVMPLRRRDIQPASVGACFNLLWRIEDRNVASADLILPVSCDPLGAGVPTAHAALRIESEDRVIPGAFNQQAEVFQVLELGFYSFPHPGKQQAERCSDKSQSYDLFLTQRVFVLKNLSPGRNE